MHATIDGTRLFYRTVGDPQKYALFLIHGGPGLDHMEMYPWHNELADRFYLVYVDLRGQGRSERVEPETLTLERFAADITGLAAAVGLDRYAVLGHSFGAFVALTHAVTDGGASHYVISGGTASMRKSQPEIEANLDAFEPLSLREQVRESWAMEPTIRTAEDSARALSMQWPFHFANVESMNATFQRLEVQHPGWQEEAIFAPEVLAYFATHEYAIELENQLHAVEKPTLLMTGEFDRTCTPRAAREMHEGIRQSELVIIPAAGHQTYMEQPAAYFEAVRTFFAHYSAGEG